MSVTFALADMQRDPQTSSGARSNVLDQVPCTPSIAALAVNVAAGSERLYNTNCSSCSCSVVCHTDQTAAIKSHANACHCISIKYCRWGLSIHTSYEVIISAFKQFDATIRFDYNQNFLNDADGSVKMRRYRYQEAREDESTKRATTTTWLPR